MSDEDVGVKIKSTAGSERLTVSPVVVVGAAAVDTAQELFKLHG